MPIKKYPPRYVRTYQYKNESGETEDITFMANGYLFPLFKSYSGIELGAALEDYKRGLMGIVTPETAEVIAKLDIAQSAEEKMQIVAEKSEVLISMLRSAQETANVDGGLSLIELLLIVTHVCALPENEHAEALGIGTEILPQEVYEDPALAFEILELALQYDNNVKKNSMFKKSIAKRAQG